MLAVGMTDGSCEISVVSGVVTTLHMLGCGFEYEACNSVCRLARSQLPGVEGRPDAGAEAEQALGYLRKVSGSHLVT